MLLDGGGQILPVCPEADLGTSLVLVLEQSNSIIGYSIIGYNTNSYVPNFFFKIFFFFLRDFIFKKTLLEKLQY